MRGDVFVDSGAWVAISIERDAHHEAARAAYWNFVSRPTRFITTNLIVAESYTLIHRFGGHLLAMQFLASLRRSSQLLRIYADAALEEDAEAILHRYADQDFSYVDAVSFALMRSRGITDAFAFDHHFSTAGFTLLPANQ